MLFAESPGLLYDLDRRLRGSVPLSGGFRGLAEFPVRTALIVRGIPRFGRRKTAPSPGGTARVQPTPETRTPMRWMAQRAPNGSGRQR